MPEASVSLSELLQQVKGVLGAEFPGSYWVIAEIMELHENRNGHCYLELIEKNADNDSLLARARGTIWSSRYSMLRPFFEASTGTSLRSGIKLLCKVSVEFHEQYGLSLNVTDIDPSYTLGDLAQKKQQVIRKLREEGVMDMNKEIPFPLVPQRIAIISSESAAGYGDFMESLHHNIHGFHFHSRLFPSVMQGEEVPASITAALDRIFEMEAEFDCVVIIRGGGSRADLESFNHYDLAYFITQFPLPVITGIGHERDESVADMVAAFGLKTPTAVAEFLIDRLLTFEFRLSALQEQLARSVKHIDSLESARLERYRRDLHHLSRQFLKSRSEQLHQAALMLRRGIGTMVMRKKEALRLMETRTALVNPHNIMKRGYSMTLSGGKVITSSSEVKPGDLLETRLYKGTLWSSVERSSDTGKK